MKLFYLSLCLLGTVLIFRNCSSSDTGNSVSSSDVDDPVSSATGKADWTTEPNTNCYMYLTPKEMAAKQEVYICHNNGVFYRSTIDPAKQNQDRTGATVDIINDNPKINNQNSKFKVSSLLLDNGKGYWYKLETPMSGREMGINLNNADGGLEGAAYINGLYLCKVGETKETRTTTCDVKQFNVRVAIQALKYDAKLYGKITLKSEAEKGEINIIEPVYKQSELKISKSKSEIIEKPISIIAKKNQKLIFTSTLKHHELIDNDLPGSLEIALDETWKQPPNKTFEFTFTGSHAGDLSIKVSFSLAGSSSVISDAGTTGSPPSYSDASPTDMSTIIGKGD